MRFIQKEVSRGVTVTHKKDQDELQAFAEPKANTSSSTVHRYKDNSSFSNLAEGNTGAMTPKLPNPCITIFKSQYGLWKVQSMAQRPKIKF